ncbi:MAG: DUF2188 domain-containing protein [Actinomycetota bacterium]|nr:DUF2188 domain-containing protein [Actinomycetota bacterium]
MTKQGDQWLARKEGATRAGVRDPTKKEVEAKAREQARREKTELVVHDREGKIQRRDSYGGDPYPPRG